MEPDDAIREAADAMKKLGRTVGEAAEATRNLAAVMRGVEREQFMLAIQSMLPPEKVLQAQALADGMTDEQLAAYVEDLARHGWTTAKAAESGEDEQ